MKVNFTSIVAVLGAVTLIGSVFATTTLLQQQASAIIIYGKEQIDEFKRQTEKLQNSVINSTGVDEIEKLFDGWKRSVLKTFEEPPTIDVNGSGTDRK